MNGYGLIPDEVRDEVLKRNDIVDIVGQYVHLSKNGKYLKGLCPFHSEKTPSFTVTPEKQIFHCYGCGKSGTAIQFVMGLEGYSYPEAITHLAELAGIPITWGSSDSYAERNPRNEAKDRLIEAHELTAKMYHYILMNTTEGQEALRYLRERGINDKLIEQFQIGYAPPNWDMIVKFLTKRQFDLALVEKGGIVSARTNGEGYVDRFRNRVMFPIWDRRGRIVGFAGRVLDGSQPKYLNSPETMLFNKSKLLYNVHQARPHIKRSGEIVLFEGFADVIQAWEAQVMNGVATMGTALTSEHVQLLKQLGDSVTLCYDGDDAGQAAAMKSIDLLEGSGLHVAVAMLPDRMDPDEFIKAHGAERFRHAIIASAVTPTKFKLISLRRNHILLEDDGKRRFKDAALRVVAKVESPVEREMHLKELASLLELSGDSAIASLKQECANIRQKLQKNNQNGDNQDNWWNNVRNDKQVISPPVLRPAYVYAERSLLALMFQDIEVSNYVERNLGEQFNVDDHAALAAYLYAYYAQGKEPDFSCYLATLQDDRLEKTAASISMAEVPLRNDTALLDDYIGQILKVPRHREIERKKEEMVQAERSGDILRAAQIAQDIIALEQQLKR
ncbi:DNA primase [Paenibacillus sp. E194]|uniref:DNA primase n=1 Tax=Paenibacillus alvei TS-15 TaxID=1117108 RepID=S9U2Q5_PAEAL|nr:MULTISPECIES: DNA primase [Paenibacillus]EPY08851.1 DNA primase [Paenibacillus alvei TS-15]KJB86965.1 DNA primase [Paenibacillus sp. E194]